MKLRDLRTDAGLSQVELAVKADVSVATIGAIEQGARLPSAKTGRRLAAALGVDLSEIDEVVQSREARVEMLKKEPVSNRR